MEFQFPGHESQEILREGHGKSWKGNMLGENSQKKSQTNQ